MTYGIIIARLFAMAATLLNLRCEYLVLDVRSKRLLALCTVLGYITSELGRVAGTPSIVGLLVINPLVSIAAPIVLSQGPLRVRTARVLVINLTSLFSEVVCTICYLTLEGELVYRTVTASNFPNIISTYMTGTFVHVLLTELVILRLRDADPSWEMRLELPILGFVVGSYFFLAVGIYRYGISESDNPFILLLILAIAALSIVLCFALHSVVKTETMIARDAARRAATIRQTRHVRRQIEESAMQVLRMRHLRHDLANQVGVVMELARADHIEEADHYLAELIERAQDYVEGQHG